MWQQGAEITTNTIMQGNYAKLQNSLQEYIRNDIPDTTKHTQLTQVQTRFEISS